MIDNRLVGKKISALRQENGLTQQQLAAMMNVSHQAVSKWEGGQALPDIQTMLELTRFFGITIEQLIAQEETASGPKDAPDIYETEAQKETYTAGSEPSDVQKEANHMSIQQLLQMAPFMSKETVEEIALGIEEKFTAAQLARIAPFVCSECLEKLIDIHKPELSWETLRRMAPFMSREYVDRLARSIANGSESVKPASDGINKTINDIGKAFDDIGKGVEKAVRKAWRFGETVINEVSNAINDMSSDNGDAAEVRVRSERAVALRRRAFERALDDGKWEWLGAHIGEVDADAELRGKIIGRAREMGMNDWICRYMGGHADEETIDAAIQADNWEWLGENAEQMDAEMQAKVALAAAQARNWVWLAAHAGQLSIRGCALQLATAALEAGQDEFVVRCAEINLLPEEKAKIAFLAAEGEKWELLARLAPLMESKDLDTLAEGLAGAGKWAPVRTLVEYTGPEAIEKMMEAAVEQGDFDAVDMLDAYL